MYALGLTIKYTCSYRLDLQEIQGYPTLEIPEGGPESSPGRMRCSRGQGWGRWSSINICRRLASREANSSQPKLRFGWEASSARVPVWLVTYNLETGHTISFQPTVHRLWHMMTVNTIGCSSFLPVMCDAALFEFSSPVMSATSKNNPRLVN